MYHLSIQCPSTKLLKYTSQGKPNDCVSHFRDNPTGIQVACPKGDLLKCLQCFALSCTIKPTSINFTSWQLLVLSVFQPGESKRQSWTDTYLFHLQLEWLLNIFVNGGIPVLMCQASIPRLWLESLHIHTTASPRSTPPLSFRVPGLPGYTPQVFLNWWMWK